MLGAGILLACAYIAWGGSGEWVLVVVVLEEEEVVVVVSRLGVSKDGSERYL